MCIWKIRCPKLPVEVECTMEILQVHLFSKKCGEIACAHKDLQLMYSTAIMRFINQLTFFFGKKMKSSLTYYKIAEILKIPDWIVTIRHEVAHSNFLPPIELLDLAAAFVLEWLYNNYWIPEAKHACDLVRKEIVLPEGTEQKLKICLNLWQACKLYKYGNCNKIGEIPNSSLRLYLSSLWKRTNILNDYIWSPENLSALTTLESYFINDGTCGKSNVKVSAVLTFLKNYLTTLFPRNIIYDNHSKNIFIKSLIDCELFLPTMSDHTFYSDGHSLRGSLSSLWREVLEMFHKAQLLPNLIQKLAVISVEDNSTSRRLVAACWISHLTESLCTPSDEIDVFVELRENWKFASFFLKRDEYAVSDIEKVLSRNVLRNLNLSKNVILNNRILENTVNKVTVSPNIYTIIFLPRLLDLLNPPLDQAAKNGIIQLVKLYSKIKECISTSDTLYTVDMLFEFNLCKSKSESEEKYEEIGQSKSVWSKKHGVYDWSKYPLGRLPQVL